MSGDVRLDLVAWLAGGSLLLLGTIVLLRDQLARRSSGRLAQLRFRRLHGVELARQLDGRLDPQPGSPWIEGLLDGRPIRLVAAPVEGRMQAGVQLLAHDLPANVWHTGGEPDDVEAADGIDPQALATIIEELRRLEVDSLACGTPITSDPRPPHILRLRFDDAAELPARLGAVAPVLLRLEQLGA